MEDMKVLLGSNSPRRNELLAQMAIPFAKVEIMCEENFDESMEPSQVPLFLSKKKSYAYTQLKKNELLITADTVVIKGATILNKPTDTKEAAEMLGSLSNGAHDVVTGVTLRTLLKEVSFTATTKVWLNPISPEDIAYYIDTYKPYDKAGAYGIQEWFGLTQAHRIEGCFYNVVGLPCSLLYTTITKHFNL